VALPQFAINCCVDEEDCAAVLEQVPSCSVLRLCYNDCAAVLEEQQCVAL
jgi:hypothetical protein